jgi:hypothetical protein
LAHFVELAEVEEHTWLVADDLTVVPGGVAMTSPEPTSLSLPASMITFTGPDSQ